MSTTGVPGSKGGLLGQQLVMQVSGSCCHAQPTIRTPYLLTSCASRQPKRPPKRSTSLAPWCASHPHTISVASCARRICRERRPGREHTTYHRGWALLVQCLDPRRGESHFARLICRRFPPCMRSMVRTPCALSHGRSLPEGMLPQCYHPIHQLQAISVLSLRARGLAACAKARKRQTCKRHVNELSVLAWGRRAGAAWLWGTVRLRTCRSRYGIVGETGETIPPSVRGQQ